MPSLSNHTHEQTVAATDWNITHGLNTIAPVVDVYIDVEGKQTKILPASVEVVDLQNVKVTFSAPRAGVAAVR